MTDEDLLRLARTVGDDWREGPYYDDAEAGFQRQWDIVIWPFIEGNDFSVTIELAGGHGRNTERLRHLAGTLYVVDINEENIQFLSNRFAQSANVVPLLTDGVSLPGIDDQAATFVYTFDSMVHFDSDVVRTYLREFHRVLRPGGTVFCHHSNYAGDPTGTYRDHPGWRNYMSLSLFQHYASKEGLDVLRSEPLVWSASDDPSESTDGLTLLRKP